MLIRVYAVDVLRLTLPSVSWTVGHTLSLILTEASAL